MSSEGRDKRAPVAQEEIAYRSLFRYRYRDNNINRTSLLSLCQEYLARRLLRIARFLEQFSKEKLQKNKNSKEVLKELRRGWPTRGL